MDREKATKYTSRLPPEVVRIIFSYIFCINTDLKNEIHANGLLTNKGSQMYMNQRLSNDMYQFTNWRASVMSLYNVHGYVKHYIRKHNLRTGHYVVLDEPLSKIFSGVPGNRIQHVRILSEIRKHMIPL